MRELRDLGVVRIEYVTAFPARDDAWVWLVTATDAQRDAHAGAESHLLARVRSVAEQGGFPPAKVTGGHRALPITSRDVPVARSPGGVGRWAVRFVDAVVAGWAGDAAGRW